jgi:hypothetical protein
MSITNNCRRITLVQACYSWRYPIGLHPPVPNIISYIETIVYFIFLFLKRFS